MKLSHESKATIKFETIYNKHIKECRKYARGLKDSKIHSEWPRLEAVRDYFHSAGHPHAQFTYEFYLGNQRYYKDLSSEMMCDMASLVTTRELESEEFNKEYNNA